MQKFGKYTAETRSLHGGEQAYFMFSNKLAVSVVRHEFSYGTEEGLWEAAVIKYGRLMNIKKLGIEGYEDVDDSVIGYMTEEMVEDFLDKVKKIPSPSKQNKV